VSTAMHLKNRFPISTPTVVVISLMNGLPLPVKLHVVIHVIHVCLKKRDAMLIRRLTNIANATVT
jgi:hypothetical protein